MEVSYSDNLHAPATFGIALFAPKAIGMTRRERLRLLDDLQLVVTFADCSPRTVCVMAM
jgi:hypothetical protein